MKEFVVVDKPVVIENGTIGLTEAQYLKRRIRLEKTGRKNVYNILEPVTFKAGEIIKLENIEKTIRSNMVLKSEFDKKGDAAAEIEIDIAEYAGMKKELEAGIKRIQELERDLGMSKDVIVDFEKESAAILKENEDLKNEIDRLKGEKPA
jgi:hypothetical protein